MSDYEKDILKAKDHLNNAVESLKKFATILNHLEEEGTWASETDDNLRSLYLQFSQLENSSVQNIIGYMKQLNRPIIAEGNLVLQENKRYSVDGHELSSGSPVEIYDDEDEEEHYHYWYPTRIEHSHEYGGYYAVGRPKIKLDGKKARIRR